MFSTLYVVSLRVGMCCSCARPAAPWGRRRTPVAAKGSRERRGGAGPRARGCRGGARGARGAAHLLGELELLADRALGDLVLFNAQRRVAHLDRQAVIQVKQAHLMTAQGRGAGEGDGTWAAGAARVELSACCNASRASRAAACGCRPPMMLPQACAGRGGGRVGGGAPGTRSSPWPPPGR
jgi:hypothetical protein